MQLLRVVFCFCVIVQTRATGIESAFQERDATKGPEFGFKPEPLPAENSGVEKKVVPAPGPLLKLLDGSASKVLELNSDRGGRAEIPDNLQVHVAGSDQLDGDARLKRSPHRRFKGCSFCGYGGGGYYTPPVYVQPVYAKPVYVQPVYAKPVYVQPVYVKPVVYTQPVYQKPVYSQPHYSSGCSTCGQWGGGGGSYSFSQSSASSSSYGYGYGKK